MLDALQRKFQERGLTAANIVLQQLTEANSTHQ